MKKIIIAGAFFAIVSAAILYATTDFFNVPEIKIERIFKKIFYFAQNQTAQVFDSIRINIVQIPVPFYRQEHALTCEVAALRMALNYHGMNLTEDELLNQLSIDTTEPKTSDNIWGDPDLGFVGDIDGSIFKGTGYGVYESPVYDLAAKYRPAAIMRDPELFEVLEEVKEGHPVLVWGLLSRRNPIIWRTKEGKEITAHPGEHVRVVAGFYGTILNPTSIILMDPIYGKIRMSKEKFLADWKVMEKRTIVIR